MDAFKISVKFFAEEGATVGHDQIVPVFHSWIQSHAIPEHTLIDVADYSHVPNGPGTVLIADEANFYLDHNEGRLGATYARKRRVEGSFQDRLRQAFTAALQTCARLEDDPQLVNRIKFRTDEAAVRIHDRLLAANTLETYQQLRPDFERVAA